MPVIGDLNSLNKSKHFVLRNVILGIETSCDDTSAAVLVDGVELANVTANQDVHAAYGGVVPELASRAHQKNIIPVVHQALKQAGVSLGELTTIGYTQGPGLMGSLLVGSSFAKGLATSLGIPLIGVHHMRAHILAHFIKLPHEPSDPPQFPFISLTVSGGHTQLVLVNDYFDMKVIGQTLDDAAGEAFDKVAKMLGLPYPGGPEVDKHAKHGNPKAHAFAIANTRQFNFSFSGFKTSFLYFLQKQTKLNESFIADNLDDLCASAQHIIVETLLRKLKKASLELGIGEIAIAGGVSANSGLRDALEKTAQELGWNVHLPRLSHTTDNASMIAITAQLARDCNYTETDLQVPLARWTFDE